MVRTTIIPDHANIEVSIPQSYIGKKLEVMVYAVDEVENEHSSVSLQSQLKNIIDPKPTKPSEFKQILSHDRVGEYLEHIKKTREEWQERF